MTQNNKADFESEKPGGVSRRTVTRGMAWAVPAIAIAAPVPAFAGASQGILTLEGTGCKLPGNSNDIYKGYAFNLTAQNTTASVFYCVRILTASLDGINLGSVTVVNLATGACSNLGNPFCVPPNTTLSDLAIVTANATNSSNGQLVVTYEVKLTSGPGVTCASSCSGTGAFVPAPPASTGINDAPPINGTSCSQFTLAQKLCLRSLSLASLDQATVSPDQATVSPDKATVSPDKATVSPDQATVSPDKATVSPDQATVSPDEPTP